jgi:hypothetical protein
MESLNSLVAYYQNTGLGLAEILNRLAMRIYNYPLGKFKADEDDCGEFYLYFYPRLLRTLSRFQDRGKPFEWYFNSVLSWHYKMYCAWKRKERIRWAVARQAMFWDLPDPAPVGRENTQVQEKSINIIALDRFNRSRVSTCRKRILYLALKNARHLDDAAVSWISAVTGIEEDHLIGMVERLRRNLYKRELRLHKLYRRQNKIFTKIFLLQQNLAWEFDPVAKAEIALSLCDLRRRLRNLQQAVRRVRLHPSNREIAELLQVPKGTVDTSLYWLRKQMSGGNLQSSLEQTPQLCA